jgi:hypothetical protein
VEVGEYGENVQFLNVKKSLEFKGFFFCGEGPRSNYGRTAALRLIVQPYDEDEEEDEYFFFHFSK